MAVLIEGISVVVRRDAIDAKFPDGWDGFVEEAPNLTLCTDGILARVGFMSPQDVQEFTMMLTFFGLQFQQNGKAIDLTVVDQQSGPTIPTDWLEFAKIPFGEKPFKVAAAWLFEGPRIASGIHFPSGGLKLATPDGWAFENSLSANFGFEPTPKLNLNRIQKVDPKEILIDSMNKKLKIERAKEAERLKTLGLSENDQKVEMSKWLEEYVKIVAPFVDLRGIQINRRQE